MSEQVTWMQHGQQKCFAGQEVTTLIPSKPGGGPFGVRAHPTLFMMHISAEE